MITIFDALYSKFIVATIILLLGFILGKLTGKLIKKLLAEIELNKIVKEATDINVPLDMVISSASTYFIYFIFVLWAIEKLGLSALILNIIGIGIIAIIIFSVILAIKDFMPNAFAGIYIKSKKIIKEGDIISFDGIRGEVISIELVETKLKTKDDLLMIPNSMLAGVKLAIKKGHSIRRSKSPKNAIEKRSKQSKVVAEKEPDEKKEEQMQKSQAKKENE